LSEPKSKCPDCTSEKYYKAGVNPSGAKQRYCCLRCGTTWSVSRQILEEEIKGY